LSYLADLSTARMIMVGNVPLCVPGWQPAAMPILLPASLTAADSTEALRLLRAYYGEPFAGPGSRSGAAFDTWDSTGTRSQDLDRFTADDLVAISLLSVQLSGQAARRLLVEEAELYSELLAAVGPDRDLADEEKPFAADGPEWALDAALRDLPWVGATKASKLFARKRPRLRSVYDSVVSEVLGTRRRHWETVRQALRDDSGALQATLLRLRAQAGLPEAVSAVRILDVVVWMEGKQKGLKPVPDEEVPSDQP